MSASPLEALTPQQLRQVLNVGAAFSALQIAVDVIEKTAFDDDDAEAINWLPLELRAHTLARIIDAAEGIREELREIDARILVLTEPAQA